jgi:hypothetical protein
VDSSTCEREKGIVLLVVVVVVTVARTKSLPLLGSRIFHQ